MVSPRLRGLGPRRPRMWMVPRTVRLDSWIGSENALSGHSVAVLGKRGWRVIWLVTLFTLWTFGAVSCAGLVAMSGAHADSGKWPLGATAALVVILVAWAVVPGLLWRQRRNFDRSA